MGGFAPLIGSFGMPIVPDPAGEAIFVRLSGRQSKDHAPPQPIASSSSIMAAITDRPPSQNFGSLASSPNGLSSSE